MANKRPEPGSSLEERFPELAKQWNPTNNGDLTPDLVGPGNHRKVWWSCRKGHEWVATIYSRVAGNKCPFCSNQKVLKGYNDLATTNPDLATQAYGWDPATLTAVSGKKRDWQCANGHVWSDTPAHRSYGRNCPICANKKILAGYNDLASQRDDIAREWHPLKNQPLLPTEVGVASHKSVWWMCAYSHEWKSTITNRTNRLLNAGCPYCSNQKVLPGFNDLATTHPTLATEADGWDPTTLTSGANKKRGWRCPKGHRWSAIVASRARGNGCPSCSTSGFNPNEKGWLYFLSHPEWDMLQVGITNNPDMRLADHARLGWELLEVRGPMAGSLTQTLERNALAALRKRGAALGSRTSSHKFDGFTEAWTRTSLDVGSLSTILEWVYEDD